MRSRSVAAGVALAAFALPAVTVAQAPTNEPV